MLYLQNTDYIINFTANLMMEIFGHGISSLTTMLGLLGMAVHAGSHCSWSEIADLVGRAQQKVADKVQQLNLEIEIDMMKKKGIIAVPDGDKMRWPLTVSYDMGWQKRASGVQYNISSGHGFLVGAHSNRILGCVCYSKHCAKCSRE